MTPTDALDTEPKAEGPPTPACAVLVVGAQWAGRRVHHHLAHKDCQVTLVDAKPFFEYTPSLPRCLVQPAHAPRILVPHGPDTTHATVTRLQLSDTGAGGWAETADGRQLAFDFCVLATGSAYPAPFKADLAGDKAPGSGLEERLREVEAAAARLAGAGSVVVVGGGPVGVETVAELAGHFGRAKRLTLVCASDRLLPTLPPGASDYSAAWLQQRGVELLLGQRLEDLGEVMQQAQAGDQPLILQTSAGVVLKADAVVDCTGARPRGQLAAGLLGAQGGAAQEGGVAEEGGAAEEATAAGAQLWGLQGVEVLPTLQVVGQACVFAVGDCAAAGTHERTALSADVQATLAAQNIARIRGGQPLLRWPQDAAGYAGGKPASLACVSLHEQDGLLVCHGLVVTGWLASAVKALLERLQLLAVRSWWAAALWVAVERSALWLSALVALCS